MSPAESTGAAAQRLEASHAAIAAALAADGTPTPHEARNGNDGVAGWLLDAADAGFFRNPVRASLHLAGDAVRESVAPIVREHPWALVGAAAAGGALVAAVRPWRWAGQRGARPGMLFSLATPLALQLLGRVLAPRPAPAPPDEAG